MVEEPPCGSATANSNLFIYLFIYFKNIRSRMRELAKSLETKEAEIVLVEQEIQQLETNVQDGTDQSSSEEDLAESLIVSQ